MSRNGREIQAEYVFGDRDYIVHDVLELPSYELDGASMMVSDVVWGEELIGDQEYDGLLMELARSPLFRRLQAVEQLTLPADFSTIPNTSRFSRWQHIWGSLVFVRKMTEDDSRFSERNRIVLQLRTLFSDVGQTAFSHLGDWIFQEGETSEDLHDQELQSLLEGFGVDKLLEEYGIGIDETVFPGIEDWVECPSPDLCVDRVDYGLREILRWMSPPSKLIMYKSQLADPKSLFQINDDNMLEAKSQEFAHQFATTYNMLPTEHWAQPAHRLQLELMQTAVKYALLDGHFSDGLNLGSRPHPRDRLYGIDADFDFAFQGWDGIKLSETMKSIGRAQRQLYVVARRHDIASITDNLAAQGQFPDPMKSYSWQSKEFGLSAPQIEIEEIEPERGNESRITMGKIGLKLDLHPLKPRSIDPLVASDGTSMRLSELDPSFADYRADQNIKMSQGYTASLLLNKRETEKLYRMHQSTVESWREAADQPRSVRDLREIVAQAAMYAGARRFDNITER